MMKLPMAAFVCTTEVFVNTARELQRIADQGIDAMAGWILPAIGGAPAGAEFPPGPEGARPAGSDIPDNAPPATYKETQVMNDQDLSGDDLKYVSYTILFTKRDLEAPLEREQQDVVNYSTNGGSYGALKIAKFIYKVAQGKVKRPAAWRDSDYPPDAQNDNHWKIPEDDLKYITFIYSVDRRLPRQEAEYDKDQVKVLKEIRNRL